MTRLLPVLIGILFFIMNGFSQQIQGKVISKQIGKIKFIFLPKILFC
jgi:hypothetical protein